VYLWPRPTDAELAAYYAGEYRSEYDGAVSPEVTYRKASAEAVERAERVRPLLCPEARVLEVGAGCGGFLEAVRPYAACVLGVEPGTAHRAWAEQALGLDMVGDLSDLGTQRFDCIGLFHTLEHVPNPVSFIARVAEHLSPGGTLAIEVPNVEDALIAQYAIPAFARLYYQRAHLYYFSAGTLAATVKAAGGDAEITGIQRYDLSNHLRWMLTREPGGQGYYRAVLGDEAHDAYARALIDAGHADTLWAIARFPAETS
jgi:2-polyprenyl-3-methyl-5-hydroxy-6-metoxy-1,4-benzoquinol methylase